MGLRDVLLGRKQLKEAAGERLFALSTAAVTLDTELGLKPAGAAGIVFKPQSSGEFVRAESEMQQLLDSVAAESGTKLDRRAVRGEPAREILLDRQLSLELRLQLELARVVALLALAFRD
ncbi:MAG: hypothetical protein QOF50_1367, partial [Gaiellaceae bacterium]|nr:hypothetical protein [Gaiellaceae bacterium]